MNNTCVVCKENAIVKPDRKGRDGHEILCPRCGKYQIDGMLAVSDLAQYGKKHLISGIIRNISETGKPIELTFAVIENIFDSNKIPEDPFEIIDLLLLHIVKRSGKIQNAIKFKPEFDYSLLFLENKRDFIFYVNKAKELGYLEYDNSQQIRLTLNGWKRLSEIKKLPQKSNRAFVAMWFDSKLNDVWEHGFKSALIEVGFKPQRIDLQEHNEKICDRIITEIKQSSLLVADFTGQRGGVYFEAGFAMGLGIPVIWTCSKKDIENLHFDTRQYNHIVWKDFGDLRTKLVNRINATIL